MAVSLAASLWNSMRLPLRPPVFSSIRWRGGICGRQSVSSHRKNDDTESGHAVAECKDCGKSRVLLFHLFRYRVYWFPLPVLPESSLGKTGSPASLINARKCKTVHSGTKSGCGRYQSDILQPIWINGAGLHYTLYFSTSPGMSFRPRFQFKVSRFCRVKPAVYSSGRHMHSGAVGRGNPHGWSLRSPGIPPGFYPSFSAGKEIDFRIRFCSFEHSSAYHQFQTLHTWFIVRIFDLLDVGGGCNSQFKSSLRIQYRSITVRTSGRKMA